MSEELVNALSNLRFKASEWKFVDLRINIPPKSFGSDAINPHTQYSNPIALMGDRPESGIGASFTLGTGNEMVCKGADHIVKTLDGLSVSDLISTQQGFYETLTNPLQLRWLSPYSGLPLMSAGLIVNTLLDAASKSVGLPTWEFLSRLPSDYLIKLINLRHLRNQYSQKKFCDILDQGLIGIDRRCLELKQQGIPVYYTTWIGHNAETITEQILKEYNTRQIKTFKIKISEVIEEDKIKLTEILRAIPENINICVDANQTLSLDIAKRWLTFLSSVGVNWLEEPFAPDNVGLFQELIHFKKENNLSCEIVTGENCPNHYTACGLMESGIDRFQADPCRMLGIIDTVVITILSSLNNCNVTPHAGGSSLDELSPHIQLFNLARICTGTSISESLTENVGFCSHFFKQPTIVKAGKAQTPSKPGLLVGLSDEVMGKINDYRESITWLEL